MEHITKDNQPKQEPILAMTVFCMDSQVKMIDKLNEAIDYIKSLTPSEFEGRKEINGMIIKIVNLQ